MKSAGRSGRQGWRVRGTIAAVGLAIGVACWARADTDPPEKLSAEAIAAQSAARLALMDLKAAGTPTQQDYQIASEILATAATLAASSEPDKRDDQTILRLWLEAASAAGDDARVREISRRLLRLDGADTVAQLRVISANIADMQTADARIAAYDRLLGEDGAAIDDSVRSRLALDAALLMRERGDLNGFADRLTKAMQLDPTNKDAATLALTFYAQTKGEAIGMADLMMAVLYADPFDPEVYQSLVGLMLESGAYRGAARFGVLAQKVYAMLGMAPGGEERTQLDLAEWNRQGPELVIQRLTKQLELARDAAVQERKALETADKPVDGVPKPQDIRLPFGAERVRLIAASSLGDKERASTFLMELAETGRRHSEVLIDPVKRPKEMTEEDVTTRIQQYLAEMVWLRVWSGLQLDDAANGLQVLREGKATDSATMTRLEAWLALRSGDRDIADRALGAQAETDPLSLLGLAVLAEQKGDKKLAASRYAQVAQRLPAELAGAYARTRYQILTGGAQEPSATARELDEIAADAPAWLDAMIDEPRRTVSLEVTPLRHEMSAVERTPFRVTLRNNARIPLAIGAGKPIDTRLLFSPSVEIGTQKLPAADMVEVVSMDRRLRLMPGEQLDIVAWPDLGVLSYALELTSVKQTRVRWRVVQGFELSEQRLYEPCAQCTTAETPTMVRRPANRAEAVAEAMRWSLQTGGARELSETLQSLMLRMANPNLGQPLAAQDIDALVEVLARRFGSLQRASKVVVLCGLPTSGNLPPVVRLDQLAAQDADENVLAIQMALRTSSPDDPIFKSPRVTESARLTELARLVSERLTAQRPSFAMSQIQVPQVAAAAAPTTTPAADAARAAAMLPIGPDHMPVPIMP